MPEHAWICRISRGPSIIDSEAEAVSAAQDMAFKQTCGRAKRFASVSQRRVDQKLGAIVWSLYLWTILLLHLLANWKNLCLRWKMASDGIGVSALRVTLRLPIPEVLKQILGANSANWCKPRNLRQFLGPAKKPSVSTFMSGIAGIAVGCLVYLCVYLTNLKHFLCSDGTCAFFGKVNPIQKPIAQGTSWAWEWQSYLISRRALTARTAFAPFVLKCFEAR